MMLIVYVLAGIALTATVRWLVDRLL
nr:protein of unknown function (DUF1656) [uncultured bacterium]